MSHRVLVAICLLWAANLFAADDVEISGTYQLQVGCYETYHEEISMIVVPGKSKFSGVRHALSIPSSLRQKLRPGMKLKVKGKKRAASKRKMTKGEIRKAMYKVLKGKEGLPLHCKEMGSIIGDIAIISESTKAGTHDHGELKLKAVADDGDVVEVTTQAHIAVEAIEMLD